MSFSEDVLKVICKVPRGKLVTYKQVAHALGTKAYRAVGRALKENKTPVIVPCHRVVMSNGSIGGYNKGVDKKIRLLKSEGIEVKNGKVVNFKECLFKL